MTSQMHETVGGHSPHQLLVVLDSEASAAQSRELAQLRELDRDGLIRLVDSRAVASSADDKADVDSGLYELVYGLLHPDHDGGIATVEATQKAMQVAVAVRQGADVFVTVDPRISQHDRPFERETDMHLMEPVEALELVMQEINDAD